MERMGLSEPEAFRWLQKTSMNRRLTMREVADAVIEQVGAGKEGLNASFPLCQVNQAAERPRRRLSASSSSVTATW